MQLPLVLALIVCDDVWIDANTGKQTILGTYGAIGTTTFPHTMPQLTIYTSLTECSARTPLRVRLIDVDEERPPIIEKQMTIESSDAREVIQGTIRASGVVFSVPGEYRVQLWAFNEILLERRLVLVRLKENSNG